MQIIKCLNLTSQNNEHLSTRHSYIGEKDRKLGKMKCGEGTLLAMFISPFLFFICYLLLSAQIWKSWAVHFRLSISWEIFAPRRLKRDLKHRCMEGVTQGPTDHTSYLPPTTEFHGGLGLQSKNEIQLKRSWFSHSRKQEIRVLWLCT